MERNKAGIFSKSSTHTNCYMNIHFFSFFLFFFFFFFFSELPLSLKDYSHNQTKHELKGTSKIPISQLFSDLVNWDKFGSTS